MAGLHDRVDNWVLLRKSFAVLLRRPRGARAFSRSPLQLRRTDAEHQETDTEWACLPRMIHAWHDDAITRANGRRAVLKDEVSLSLDDVRDIKCVRVVHPRRRGRLVALSVRFVIDHHQPEDSGWQLYVHIGSECRGSGGRRTLGGSVEERIEHARNTWNDRRRNIRIRNHT